jgi:hypothetical protein
MKSLRLLLILLSVLLISLIGLLLYNNRYDLSQFNAANNTLPIDKQNEIGKLLASTRVFMYHGIDSTPLYNNFLNVYKDDFKDQLNWLVDKGYSFITTEKVIQAVLRGQVSSLPRLRAIVQLDDGYASVLIANDIAREVSTKRKLPIPLEIGLVLDNINKSNQHLTYNNYLRLQTYGNSIISHTKTHCSLGDDKILNYSTGTDKKLIGNSKGIDCQFYPTPNEGYYKPLDVTANIKQLSEPFNYIQDKFKTSTPAMIYPYGHNSTQNIETMKKLSIYFGYNTAFQKVCNSDLNSTWIDNTSNYNLNRTTVNGLQKWLTDDRSWFVQYNKAKCG